MLIDIYAPNTKIIIWWLQLCSWQTEATWRGPLTGLLRGNAWKSWWISHVGEKWIATEVKVDVWSVTNALTLYSLALFLLEASAVISSPPPGGRSGLSPSTWRQEAAVVNPGRHDRDTSFCSHHEPSSPRSSSPSPCPHYRRKLGPSRFARCHGYLWPPEWLSASQSGCSESRTTDKSPVSREKHVTEVIQQWSDFVFLFAVLFPAALTFPRSRIKQSPWLKLSQLTATSIARTERRPLTWKSLWTTTSFVTTCLNPEATPPFWERERESLKGLKC